MVMRQLSITLSLVALLQNLPAIAQVPETTSGNSSDSIQQVIAAKWMTNFSDGKFYPERLVSRAELASIMVKAFRLDKREAVNKANLTIPDVPRSYWTFNDIQTVLKTDIMKGYRGNEFFPNQKVTKAEALAISLKLMVYFSFLMRL